MSAKHNVWIFLFFFFSRAGGCGRIWVHCNWSSSRLCCSQGGDCWLCMGREEPGEISRIQSYPMCRMSTCSEVTEKLVTWKHLLLLLQYFWISKSEFKMGVEGHFVLFCFQGNVISSSWMCPIFAVKLNISFLLGNVYFDVKSWGKRYGVLTTIYPDTQDEAGKFMAPACLY